MALLFTNFAYSTLATSINDSQLSLTVAAGHGARFPAPTGGDYFYVTLESALLVREIVKVTARSTDTFTIVRAQDNTTAAAFSAGDSVALRLNAAALTGITAAATVALQSLTTDVDVSSAAAPSSGQVLMATSSTEATWQTLGAAGVFTNVTNVFTKNQSVQPVALTAGATVNVDAALSNNFTLTPNQNFTLAAPTNPTNGMVCNFVFTQGGTPYTITFDAAWQFAGGNEPTLTASASAVDFMSAYYNGATSKWICVMSKDFKA